MSIPRKPISVSATSWDNPYTKEGVRPPDTEHLAQSAFQVHDAGCFRMTEDWNYEGVCSPFWRLYHNDKPGAFLRTKGKTCPLNPDRAWLVPAGVTFDCHGKAGPQHLWIHFSPGLAAHRSWDEPSSITLHAPLRALLAWMKRNLHDKDISARKVGEISRAMLHAVFADSADESNKAPSPRLSTVLGAIERSLASPQQVPELSRIAHLSESHFSHWFRESMGMSPAAYIQGRRITEACRRLAFTDDSIEQVAEALGFTNRFHFSRVFKRVRGQGPGAFKRNGGPR